MRVLEYYVKIKYYLRHGNKANENKAYKIDWFGVVDYTLLKYLILQKANIITLAHHLCQNILIAFQQPAILYDAYITYHHVVIMCVVSTNKASLIELATWAAFY